MIRAWSGSSRTSGGLPGAAETAQAALRSLAAARCCCGAGSAGRGTPPEQPLHHRRRLGCSACAAPRRPAVVVRAAPLGQQQQQRCRIRHNPLSPPRRRPASGHTARPLGPRRCRAWGPAPRSRRPQPRLRQWALRTRLRRRRCCVRPSRPGVCHCCGGRPYE